MKSSGFLNMQSIRRRRYLMLLAASVTLIVLIAGCTRDNRARVIFDNQSACGTITARLTNTVTGEIKRADVAIGQRVEVEVQPDVFYEYQVDFTSAGRTADNYRCTAFKTGKVRVPAGTSQTFVLAAETPVPTP
jgi:hypothetical protein